ncbi:HlyD family efflux transporter periplasmic adaptor subunit [Colwellia demingiae]|uniref:HlyD family efflux transporter periplasmic adaptor subunit n=1 Tax=Colwellia demingiae TaxID=89401 RepID=A0A5C6QB87_9GAMM|nr:efflux RND transporter periplasmic adaptor subunit [Colwellia demingiae]TWX65887.1 HlyD family efflux transporter periplasmic adaptor subunit [Colwellia demingiae]
MKEIMLPYILIMWTLVKLGVIQWNLRNAVYIVSLGCFMSFMLFTAHRFWSPADLTDSSTVKAPHAVLSPLIGEQIDTIYVTHNQVLKKGELIYSLVDTDSEAKIEGAEAQVAQQEELIAQYKRDIQRSIDAPGVFALRDIEKIKSDLDYSEAMKDKAEADLETAHFEQSRMEIRAPFDGQVSITNISSGSRIGNMHIYDTSKKFVEMRIPDQSYRYIKKGQFAEFFVNAYPGEIFRGRVHSITAGTGEAMISPRASEQQVRQHVGNNTSAHGRTVVIEFIEPEGYNVPIGSTGSAWISATKPVPILGFMDIIGAATVRLKAYKAYLNAL